MILSNVLDGNKAVVQAEAGWHLLGVFFLKGSVLGPMGCQLYHTVWYLQVNNTSFSNFKDKEFYNFSTKVIPYIQ